jgi:hypothetical protein
MGADAPRRLLNAVTTPVSTMPRSRVAGSIPRRWSSSRRSFSPTRYGCPFVVNSQSDLGESSYTAN